ncbi:unnamed protein product, partial [Rotaria magnacalcarata]
GAGFCGTVPFIAAIYGLFAEDDTGSKADT